MVKLISSASRGRERRSSFASPWKVLPNEARRHFRRFGRLLFMDANLAGLLVASRQRRAQTAGHRSPTGAGRKTPGGNRGGPADLRSANPGSLADASADTSRSAGRQGGTASHYGARESDCEAASGA